MIEFIKCPLENPRLLATSLSCVRLRRFAIITDKTVAASFGKSLAKMLSQEGLEVFLFTFPSGERFKTRKTKEQLENKLFEKKLGSDTCIIALGGGIVTDLAGFLAATFCRGVTLVLIPTTLMGMVDASLGGKNGVNVPYGKNLIGSIYQPKKIIIAPSFLQNLPLKDYKNGIVEMIKHGNIIDKDYFKFLEDHSEELLNKDQNILHKAILDSIHIKMGVVEKSKDDPGLRNLLNFGHTVGHAVELVTEYTITHGEAVALGILIESHLSMQLGYLSQNDFERILNILKRFEIPLVLPEECTFEKLFEAMVLDKKSVNGDPRFVMIDKIGSAKKFRGEYCTTVKKNIIEKALTEVCVS